MEFPLLHCGQLTEKSIFFYSFFLSSFFGWREGEVSGLWLGAFRLIHGVKKSKVPLTAHHRNSLILGELMIVNLNYQKNLHLLFENIDLFF